MRFRSALPAAARGSRLLPLALFAVVAAQIETHFGGTGTTEFFSRFVYNGAGAAAAASCLLRATRRDDRATWALIGVAIASWTAGNVYYTFVSANLQVVPSPSYADAGFLGVYPAAYVAVGLLVRNRVTRFTRSIWLDGVIAGLAVGAVAVAVVFDSVAAKASGGLAPIATNLAYPIADALLIAVVVGVLALRSWSLDLSWLLIGLGFGVFALSDSVYLLRVADGTYAYGTWLDLGWLAGFVLLANAAWVRSRAETVTVFEGRRVFVVPTVVSVVCIALVVYDRFAQVSIFAISLVWLALVLVVVRMALTFEEHLTLVATFRARSVTDALTGLGNRRGMLDRLNEVAAHAPDDPHLLLLFDLNGFKAYNDAFGHLVGDALLQRLGRRLQNAVEGRGEAFRLGGDEFCVLMRGAHDDLPWAAAATTTALAESSEGFDVSCALGHAELPLEARTPDEALRLADNRMYAHKQPRDATADPRQVLLQAVREREQSLEVASGHVAELAAQTAAAAGLAQTDVALARSAAELHDVGKLAIPDSILCKPGPLDAAEWALVRRHTLIGQRIIGAAPGLEQVAAIVRSTHERWDGGGYPDGRAGTDIPVIARIIAICDAYAAMTSERPYRRRLPHEAALAELRRNGGTQFDPQLVETFVGVAERVRTSAPLALVAV